MVMNRAIGISAGKWWLVTLRDVTDVTMGFHGEIVVQNCESVIIMDT